DRHRGVCGPTWRLRWSGAWPKFTRDRWLRRGSDSQPSGHGVMLVCCGPACSRWSGCCSAAGSRFSSRRSRSGGELGVSSSVTCSIAGMRSTSRPWRRSEIFFLLWRHTGPLAAIDDLMYMRDDHADFGQAARALTAAIVDLELLAPPEIVELADQCATLVLRRPGNPVDAAHARARLAAAARQDLATVPRP